MFTGIIEEVGRVAAIYKSGNSASIEIKAERILDGVNEGDSIAVNGICLTVTSYTAAAFTADVMHETMNRSAMKKLVSGMPVNLERAMPANGRFGGHIVTGHIDGIGKIQRVQQDEIAVWYTIGTEDALMRYIIEKGSVAVDGISLTVASVQKDSFCVSVIPHTLTKTALASKRAGDLVNLENDCIGKYVEHFLKGKATCGVTKELLFQNGFMTI